MTAALEAEVALTVKDGLPKVCVAIGAKLRICTPVPFSEMACVDPAPPSELSVNTSDPGIGPATVGMNSTPKMQEPLAARLSVGQVVE